MDESQLASAISAKLGKSDADKPGEEGAETEVLASNVMSALSDKDPAAFAASLREFMRACKE